MDLRSIVNAEDTPDARKLPAPSPPKENSRPLPQNYLPRGVGGPIYENRRPTDPGRHEAKPPFPPPLRTSSSYSDTYPQSDSPIASARTMQNPYPVMRRKDPNRPSRSEIFCGKLKETSIAHIEHAGQHSYHERSSASSSQGHHSYGQSTPLAHTPTRSSPSSAGAHSTFQRPTSSHSVPTPGSAPYHPSSLTQRSPQASNNHVRLPSQPQIPQQYSSQPHTPLGPPQYARHASRESPVAYGHERTLSGGSYSQQQVVEAPPNVTGSPLAYASRPPQPERLSSAELRAREQSLSVSPKTRVGTLPGSYASDMAPQQVRVPSEQVTPAKRKANDTSLDHSYMNEQQMTPITRRSTSTFAIDGLLNETPANDRTKKSEVGHGRPSNSEFSKGSGSAQELPKSVTPTNLQSHRLSLPHQTPTPPVSTHQSFNSVPPLTNTLSEVKYSGVPMEGVVGDSLSRSMKAEPLENIKAPATNPHSSQEDHLQATPTLESQPARKKPRLEDASERMNSAAFNVTQSQPLVPQTSKSHSQPPKKKRRLKEIPIFAQSVRGPNRPASGESDFTESGDFRKNAIYARQRRLDRTCSTSSSSAAASSETGTEWHYADKRNARSRCPTIRHCQDWALRTVGTQHLEYHTIGRSYKSGSRLVIQ